MLANAIRLTAILLLAYCLGFLLGIGLFALVIVLVARIIKGLMRWLSSI